jgi:hypothetical protein
MERSSEHDELAVALAELRPTPECEFAAELDKRVAAGFPRRSARRRRLSAALRARLRLPSPRHLGYAGGGTALVAGNDSRPETRALSKHTNQSLGAFMDSERHSAGGAGGVEFSEAVPGIRPQILHATEADRLSSSAPGNRDIERSAQVTLLADPGDVAGDSAEVFVAVHDAHGIVLRSHTTQGPAGRGGAAFYLLIPSARLGDALAAISAIDEVGSRNDATADITAPTVAVGKRLHDTQAGIESLLSRLASAEPDAEREVLEARIRKLRRYAATLRSQLDRLHRRTRYSPVTVRIETGRSASTGGAWGIGNAFHDAGRILAVAAGVTLVGLAVLAPIAILILLAWLARRAWLRWARNRALA